MKDTFYEFVKNKITCDVNELDLAVTNGINRAKKQVYDIRSIINITLATAAALIIAISLNTNEQFQKKAQAYLLMNTKVNEASSKKLQLYINIGIKTIIDHIQ